MSKPVEPARISAARKKNIVKKQIKYKKNTFPQQKNTLK